MLKPGLYEKVINRELNQLLEIDTSMHKETVPIDQEEAAKVLAKYVAEIIEKGLSNVKDKVGDLASQVRLANKIVDTIINETGENSFNGLQVDKSAKQLLALIKKENTAYALTGNNKIPRPETSIAQSSLFTGAIHEPSMYSELKKEIASSDRIDMLVSFIKWSGLRLIMDELVSFTQNGGRLRVITTSYMGATDLKAVEELRKLPNTKIKLSYNTKSTRLHAKAYVFYRDTGFTTAYVGSSNLSNAAMSSGLEWNIKVAAKDLPETIQKIGATFESYWNSPDFEDYYEQEKERLEKALKSERYTAGDEQQYFFDITPYPFQQEILARLDTERKVRGYYKNLVVAATGTGKTVISAFDYKRYCSENPGKPHRLLFVAHREEILKQSRACFAGVLKNPNFGDLFVGRYTPETLNHLFISIQTFNSQELFDKTSPDFYDFIIIDEFHHAAAPSYQKLITYYKPKVLLGLTATPERMDGQNVLDYFDHRIAAEIRLPEAIERKLLSPFQYFGVTDTVDLDSLKWSRGGYDRGELEKVYALEYAVANKRANLIISSLIKYVTGIDEVKGLGFCVSIEHAKFMAAHFNKHNIPSISLTGLSSDEERSSAKDKLVRGEVRFIFVVDIYNEGVDIPQVNTVLFLRPTESLTVFLQQLGRGLRLDDTKECLTVLDFVGQANKRYNFEEKFAALLSNTTKSVRREIEEGFISVPKGCYIQLEKKAKEYILENIKNSFGNKAGFVSRMATFEEDSGLPLNLTNFAEYYHLPDIRVLYNRDNFSRLSVLAGAKDDFTEPLEPILTRAFKKICAIDSRRWISFLLDILPNADTLDENSLNENERKMLQMFQFTVFQKSYRECGVTSLKDGLVQIKNNPILFSELLEILKFNFNRIDFVDEKVELGFDCPLDLHCTYTRDQVLVALDFLNPSAMREGVKYLPDKKADIFFVTLNKAERDYSPTTMYNDYSINEWLFHWQSQSTTSVESPTGQRYINHRKHGSKILLFVREFKQDLAGAAPYVFLGSADYVKHEGSRPINITWRLNRPIPAKYLKKTNKLVVG